VRFYELAGDDDHAVLALRWEAVGAAGGLFPALDADLTLSRVDDQSSACKLSGVYRPPLGALGAGLDRMILNKVAAATIRKLMTSTGDALTAAPETARRAPAGPQPGWSWLAAPELPLAPGGHLQHGKRIRGTRGERHRGHPGSPCSLRPAAHADRVFTFRHT
jgi:hypothetical protein